VPARFPEAEKSFDSCGTVWGLAIAVEVTLQVDAVAVLKLCLHGSSESLQRHASSSCTTSPVLAGRENPSGLRRVAGSIPSVWSIVAVKSSSVTGRLAT
jgi:hypothetical protein